MRQAPVVYLPPSGIPYGILYGAPVGRLGQAEANWKGMALGAVGFILIAKVLDLF